MKRRTWTSQRARAERATRDAGVGVSGWATPSHELAPGPLAARLRLSWLRGYEAAQRDARKRKM